MPRKPTIRTNLYPYHVVARCHNKEWFKLPIETMWKIYTEIIRDVCREEGAKVISFVLMNNHFHLMVWTPRENIDRVMYWIMKRSTQEVQKRTGIINSIYGGRYKSSLLTKVQYQYNCYKYILRNPVVAGLCDLVQDYPYSTYHYSFFNQSLPFELLDKSLPNLFGSTRALESWLNKSYTDKEARSIKTGLSRNKFEFAKCNNSRKQVIPNLSLGTMHPEKYPGT
ncbi:transposase [Halobacteriovorax sp.]|uniref:transposase n=1 Tax=Halobacteriovorax sp. TaxID=2020862 RepID=UPI003AF250CF